MYLSVAKVSLIVFFPLVWKKAVLWKQNLKIDQCMKIAKN